MPFLETLIFAKSPTSGLPHSLYSKPWACGDAAPGVWHHRAPSSLSPPCPSHCPFPWHHPCTVSLCCGSCQSQGRSFAACNSKIMQRTVTQPNIPSLELPQCSRAGHSQGQGQGCSCQLALPGEVHPWELAAEAFLAEQGRISADPASSHTRSQQTPHTDPKGCLCPQLTGRSSPEEQREAQFLPQSHGCPSEGQHQGHQSSHGSHPLPPGTECQDQGSGCTDHGSGHQGEQIPQVGAFPDPKRTTLGSVSMRGDFSCLVWGLPVCCFPSTGSPGICKALGH